MSVKLGNSAHLCLFCSQVPQYILDSFIDRNAGAYCNIVVTQVF